MNITCETSVARTTPRLKEWFRANAEQAPQPDLNTFLNDVAINNEITRKCE